MPGSRILSEFEIFGLLGSGSFGIVLNGKNLLDKKKYALKAINIAGDCSESYLREIEALAQLPPHKHIVGYFCCWKDQLQWDELQDVKRLLGLTPANDMLRLLPHEPHLEILCIQMELCGENLRTWLGKQQRLNEGASLEIFKQVCNGVQHLHQHKLIHRDLKPENIFFASTTPILVKLGDLGIAAKHSAYRTAIHTKGVGTQLYVAPEQYYTDKYGTAADMYSLGFILFELFDLSLQNDITNTLIPAFMKLRYSLQLPPSMDQWPDVKSLVLNLVACETFDRPKFEDVFKVLEQISLQLQVEEEPMLEDELNGPVERTTPPKFEIPGIVEPEPLEIDGGPEATTVKNTAGPLKLPSENVEISLEKKQESIPKKPEALERRKTRVLELAKIFDPMAMSEQQWQKKNEGRPLSFIGAPINRLRDKFQQICFRCKKRIENENGCVLVEMQTWHSRCFACKKCGKLLGFSPWHKYYDNFYCDNCEKDVRPLMVPKEQLSLDKEKTTEKVGAQLELEPEVVQLEADHPKEQIDSGTFSETASDDGTLASAIDTLRLMLARQRSKAGVVTSADFVGDEDSDSDGW